MAYDHNGNRLIKNMPKTIEEEFLEDYKKLVKKYQCDWFALARCTNKILAFILRKFFPKSFMVSLFIKNIKKE